VDHLVGEAAHAVVPFGRIGDEARPVLHAYPAVPLAVETEVLAAADGTVVKRVSVPERLRASMLIVAARTRPTRGPKESRRWKWSEPQRAEVSREAGTATVDVRARVRPAPRPTSLALTAEAREPMGPSPQVLSTDPVRVPPDALLEFGFGVLDAAREFGPVEFTIRVCEGEECSQLFTEALDPALATNESWQDRGVSLAAHEGREVSFHFEVRSPPGAEEVVSLPVWGDPTIYVEAVEEAPGANLILVSLDTLRADHLPTYGYPRDTAPFLDSRLARQGVVFERATTSASTTAPSHITLFTSLQPSVHRLVENSEIRRLPTRIATLTEALRAAGFATGAVTENAAIAFGTGIERGFASYTEVRSVSETLGDVVTTLSRSRRWLERNGDRRFFLFIHTYQVHNPYEPPASHAALFPEAVPGRETPGRLPAEWHPDLYDREIRFTDDALADFITGLEARGLLEDTLVVVTSDHGEGFLEHGYLAHGAGLHQEILHVPLLFAGPGVAPGTRVDAPVGLVDLMPTLLELLGVPPVDRVMGRSFADLVRGGAPGAGWPERPLFSEAWRTERFGVGLQGRIRSARVATPSYAVRKGDRKLIRYRHGAGFRYSYYDLAEDPREMRDLYSADPDAASDLRSLIEDYVEAAAELYDSRVRSPECEAPPLDPEREERLRALGYLE
jgi:arylsulfatase A-like enzyme